MASLGVAARPGLRQILFPLSLSQCAVYLQESYALPQSHQEIEDGINGTIRTFYCHEVQAKAGAKAFLTAPPPARGCYHVGHGDRPAVIAKGLERTGLLPLLDDLITCGDLGVDKRTPTIFHYARDKMGTATEATWSLRTRSTPPRRPTRPDTGSLGWQTRTATR